MQFPRITVVTPSYNQGQFLDMAMQSVLEQGYPDLEYIVVDGGSTDESVEIIRRYENRLAWWVSEKDNGQSHAINKGLARGTGELFAFINSDDTLMPGALAAAAEAYRQGHGWITGWAMFLETEGGQWPQIPRAMGTNIDWFLSNPICQQATFWSAQINRKVGPFREDMNYTFDYEFWMRLWFVGKARPHMLRRCMGGFRMHKASKTVSRQEQFEPEFRRVRSEYRKFLSAPERRALDSITRQEELRHHRHLGWEALLQHNVPDARKHAREALRRARFSLQDWKLMACALRGY